MLEQFVFPNVEDLCIRSVFDFIGTAEEGGVVLAEGLGNAYSEDGRDYLGNSLS